MQNYTNTELWAAIYELFVLLDDRVNQESAFQGYFERHPVVFNVLGYDVAVPFDKSSQHKLPFDDERNYRPEPDFICGVRLSGEVTIFELKTPFQSGMTTSRADGNRAKFLATIESYLSQATEYVDSIRGRESARATVKAALQLNTISSYKIALVYGLCDMNEAPSVARLAEKRHPRTDHFFRRFIQ
jgi:hypothetical protein